MCRRAASSPHHLPSSINASFCVLTLLRECAANVNLTKFNILPTFPVLTDWLLKVVPRGSAPVFLFWSQPARQPVPLKRPAASPWLSACRQTEPSPLSTPGSRWAGVRTQSQALEIFAYLGIYSLSYKERNPNQTGFIRFNQLQLCLQGRHRTSACPIATQTKPRLLPSEASR